MREFKSRVSDETPQSPSRWLPTPPSALLPVKKQRRRVASPPPQAVHWLKLLIMTRDFFLFDSL